ncbi:MAG: 3-oxoacyl-ACP reductase FabG [Alphaproteobacteria bacterium]|nr:3-oxoacyl-ACP reductase FabG [Alphaproteobacteria bacterium]
MTTDPSRPLAGRTAFVSGGSRGIGRAIARALAEAGAKVAFTYRAEALAGAALEREIREIGGRALALQMEVRERDSVRAALAEAEAALGPVTVLVNNAGINKPTDFDKIADADWDDILAVNLKGPFMLAQEALAGMERAGGGSIVHIGSVSGQYGGPRTAHYAASKAGLISLAQVVARFGAPKNIRSNTVCAGLIASDMGAAGLANPAVQKAAETILLKRLGTPEEVAQAVVFLASPAASYITGQVLNVNGGLYF